MSPLYWERHPDGPFATLIRVATTYCSPDADEEAYEGLKRLAKRENDREMRVFKTELREALRDPTRLPDDERMMSCPGPSSTTTAAARHSCADSGATCCDDAHPRSRGPGPLSDHGQVRRAARANAAPSGVG